MGAMVFDVILAIVAFIRLMVYGVGSLVYSLTSFYALIDMIILTFFIMLFLYGLAFINTATTTEVLEVLLRTQRDVIHEQVRGSSLEKNEDVHYLATTSKYLKENKSTYVIKIYGMIIDRGLISKYFIAMLTGILSSILGLVAKQFNVDE